MKYYIILDGNALTLVFYAASLWYNINLDIIIQSSDCEGIINPENRCPSKAMLRTGYVENMNIYESDLYSLECLTKQHGRIEYYVFTLQNIKTCVYVQSVASSSSVIYDLQIVSRLNMLWYYAGPIKYLKGDNNGSDKVAFLKYNDDNVRTDSLFNYLNYKIITALKVLHFRYGNFHQEMYSLHLIFEPELERCVKLEDEENLLEINTFLSTILAHNLCGYGNYSITQVYYIRVQFHLADKLGSIYWKFKKINYENYECLHNLEEQDALSLQYDRLLSHTIDVNNHEIDIELFDPSVTIYYKKSSRCSVLEMKYNLVQIQGLVKSYIYDLKVAFKVCLYYYCFYIFDSYVWPESPAQCVTSLVLPISLPLTDGTWWFNGVKQGGVLSAIYILTKY